MREYIPFLFLLIVLACSNESNPTASLVKDRAVVDDNKLALLDLDQGFNDLGRYVVEGTIKSLLYDDDLSDVTIKVSIFTSDSTLIDTEVEYVYTDLQPRGETTFESEFWAYQLNNQTPDPNMTEIAMLIDGTTVSYEDNRIGSDTAGRYDFRWSRWGDSKDEVESKEPGTLTFVRTEGMEETGSTVDMLSFSDSTTDTVDVVYDFMGNELWSGTYKFKSTVPSSRLDTVRALLNDRYGTGETGDEFTSWKRNVGTTVKLYPSSDDENMRIVYVDNTMNRHLDGNQEYNELPLRAVVGE